MAKKIAKQNKHSMCMAWCVASVVIVVLVGAVALICVNHRRVVACDVKNITLTPGQTSGAAGTIYQNIDLKNNGKAKCTLSGFPTAFLYGSNGYALGGGAAARSNPSPSVITLAHGQTAHTVLGYPQAGNFDPGVCSNPSTSLKLYIPGAITPLEASISTAWCPGFSETAIQTGI
ncbi:MAG TPA: DUF4232 domain-containing protein [Patescibacteria group bacterium]|nr:DUF4232 domain-containing protein [Patescibacteria group bacterium]